MYKCEGEKTPADTGGLRYIDSFNKKKTVHTKSEFHCDYLFHTCW